MSGTGPVSYPLSIFAISGTEFSRHYNRIKKVIHIRSLSVNGSVDKTVVRYDLSFLNNSSISFWSGTFAV